MYVWCFLFERSAVRLQNQNSMVKPLLAVLTPHARYDVPAKTSGVGAAARLDTYEYVPFDRVPYRLFTSVRCVLNISANTADGSVNYEVYRVS